MNNFLFGIYPYVALTVMIVASIATPDWSPVTMGLLFGSPLLLYELSLLFARIVFAKRIAAEKAALEAI